MGVRGRPKKIRSQVNKPRLVPLASHIEQVLERHHTTPLAFLQKTELVPIKTMFYSLLACEHEPNRASLEKIAMGLRLFTGDPTYTRSYLDAMISFDE